jgi:DNA-binding GntR family transcriptional regulator
MRDASTVDELAETLQGRIMAGQIPLGTWLRQEQIADEFAVSRTPVREAFRKLQQARMLDLVPNRGALVRGPTVRDVEEAYVVRAELEGLAAATAATRITPAQLARLRASEKRFREVSAQMRGTTRGNGHGPMAAWSRANDAFHTVIQRAAGNQRLQETVTALHRTFPRSLTSLPLLADSDLLEANCAEHREIRVALEERDADAAREAMRRHILHSGELVAAWYAAHDDEAGTKGA